MNVRPELRDRAMAAARRYYKCEEITVKLLEVKAAIEQGRSVTEAVRSVGVDIATYYRWRAAANGSPGLRDPNEMAGAKSDNTAGL